jgi:hypothetical protein
MTWLLGLSTRIDHASHDARGSGFTVQSSPRPHEKFRPGLQEAASRVPPHG